MVLLTKIGGGATTEGLDVTTGAAVVATWMGVLTTGATGTAVVGTTGTTGAAGEVAAGADVTGLVTVQGQLVIVRVVA